MLLDYFLRNSIIQGIRTYCLRDPMYQICDRNIIDGGNFSPYRNFLFSSPIPYGKTTPIMDSKLQGAKRIPVFSICRKKNSMTTVQGGKRPIHILSKGMYPHIFLC